MWCIRNYVCVCCYIPDFTLRLFFSFSFFFQAEDGIRDLVRSRGLGMCIRDSHYCEGMVMPPMNQIVVQTILLPADRRDEAVLNQAKKLLSKALAPVNDALAGKDYLIGDFSAADLMLGHSCFMANRLGCVTDDMQNIKDYVARIDSRPAFKKAITMGE